MNKAGLLSSLSFRSLLLVLSLFLTCTDVYSNTIAFKGAGYKGDFTVGDSSVVFNLKLHNKSMDVQAFIKTVVVEAILSGKYYGTLSKCSTEIECSYHIEDGFGVIHQYHSLPYHQDVFFYKADKESNTFLKSLPETMYQLHNLKSGDLNTLSLQSIYSYKSAIFQMYFWFAKVYGSECADTFNDKQLIVGNVSQIDTQNYSSSVSAEYNFRYPVEERFSNLALKSMKKFVGFAAINSFANRKLQDSVDSLISQYGCKSLEVQNAREGLFQLGNLLNQMDLYFNHGTINVLLDNKADFYNADVFPLPRNCGVSQLEENTMSLLDACEAYKSTDCAGAELIKSCNCLVGINNDWRYQERFLDDFLKQDIHSLYSYAVYSGVFPMAMSCLEGYEANHSNRPDKKAFKKDLEYYWEEGYSMIKPQSLFKEVLWQRVRAFNGNQKDSFSDDCKSHLDSIGSDLDEADACLLTKLGPENLELEPSLLNRIEQTSKICNADFSQVFRSMNYTVANTAKTKCVIESYGYMSDAEAYIMLVLEMFNDSYLPNFDSEKYCYMFTKEEIVDRKIEKNGKVLWPNTISGDERFGLGGSAAEGLKAGCIKNIIDDFILGNEPIPYL